MSRTCAYQGVRNVRFPGDLTYFVFLKHPFWDSPFCLITDEFTSVVHFYTPGKRQKTRLRLYNFYNQRFFDIFKWYGDGTLKQWNRFKEKNWRFKGFLVTDFPHYSHEFDLCYKNFLLHIFLDKEGAFFIDEKLC